MRSSDGSSAGSKATSSSNTHTYNYRMPTRIPAGSHEYMVDDFAANLPLMMAEERADSDGARVADLLRAEGYIMPDEAIWTRFVRVLGEARRNELLIIYTEDLKDLGVAATDISPDGPVSQEHAAMTDALHERALAAFTIVEG